MGIVQLVNDYYDKRGLKRPSFSDALKFLVTELGEVYELDLSRVEGYVRNNPESKPKYSKELMAEELGDVLMMVIAAGMAEGVDPVDALEKKIKSKMKRLGLLEELGYKDETG
jgi:NTP pyrophosphatase (non-canonical NTP hydrolase)